MRIKFLTILFLLSFMINSFAQHFDQYTLSPLPKNRRVLLTAFSDADSRINSNMEALSNMFIQHNYDVTLMVSSVYNPPPGQDPPDFGNYYTIQDFHDEILNGQYGVVVISGHAGNHGTAIEHFETLDGMVARFHELQAQGIYLETEYDQFPWPDGDEYVIAVTSYFIPHYARLAEDAIIFTCSCNSYIWYDRNFHGDPDYYNENDYQNSDIVWLDNNVGGVFFVGTIDESNVTTQPYHEFFQYILGKRKLLHLFPIIRYEKKNHNIFEAWVETTKNTAYPDFKYKNRNNDSSIDILRLYNSPKIIKLKINNGQVYDYSYEDQIYPFCEGYYPGDLINSRKKTAIAGDLDIEIVFSKRIDNISIFGRNTFDIKIQPQSDSLITFPVEDIVWSKTTFENDTLIGKVTIPPGNTQLQDGLATIKIVARDNFHEDDSSNKLEGELDTDGDGEANGIDVNHKFDLIFPKLYFTDSNGNRKFEFSLYEIIYIDAKNFIWQNNYKVYVTEDRNWTDGELIKTGNTGEKVVCEIDIQISTDGSTLKGTVLWGQYPIKEAGKYDVIIDIDEDGIYTEGVDIVNDPNHPGFEIVDEVDWVDLTLEINNPPWPDGTKIFPKGFSEDGKKVLLWVPYRDENLQTWYQYSHSGFWSETWSSLCWLDMQTGELDPCQNPSSLKKSCPHCGGDGISHDSDCHNCINGKICENGTDVNCPDCEGTGITHHECKYCNGTGEIRTGGLLWEVSDDGKKILYLMNTEGYYKKCNWDMYIANFDGSSPKKISLQPESCGLCGEEGTLPCPYKNWHLHSPSDPKHIGCSYHVGGLTVDPDGDGRTLNPNAYKNIVCRNCDGATCTCCEDNDFMPGTETCPTCNGSRKIICP